jgi:hypothetical protein
MRLEKLHNDKIHYLPNISIITHTNWRRMRKSRHTAGMGESRLDGVVVSVRVAGSNMAEAMDFKGDKNPQHTFLRVGSKAGCPMS